MSRTCTKSSLDEGIRLHYRHESSLKYVSLFWASARKLTNSRALHEPAGTILLPDPIGLYENDEIFLVCRSRSGPDTQKHRIHVREPDGSVAVFWAPRDVESRSDFKGCPHVDLCPYCD